MLNTILQMFLYCFCGEPVLFHAPGRINLISEHTDYNSGYVLPAAIDREIFFAIRPNNSGEWQVYSVDMAESDAFDVTAISSTAVSWTNYIRGVVKQFVSGGFVVPGFDLERACHLRWLLNVDWLRQ